MSDEGRRDVKAILAMLESDGSFDHTEGFLANTDPEGLLGTDIMGFARAKIINKLKADLAKETKSNEMLQQQLAEEKAEKEALQLELSTLKEKIEGHQGTISTLTEDKKRLQRQILDQFNSLKRSSVTAFHNFEDAYNQFIGGIETDVRKLQKEDLGE